MTDMTTATASAVTYARITTIEGVEVEMTRIPGGAITVYASRGGDTFAARAHPTYQGGMIDLLATIRQFGGLTVNAQTVLNDQIENGVEQ